MVVHDATGYYKSVSEDANVYGESATLHPRTCRACR